MRAHIFVSGSVQGVFFRDSTKKKAIELNLRGWVKNLDDGRVEIIVEGDDDKVKDLIDWCLEGSKFSKVEDVDVIEEKETNEFESFTLEF